MSINHKQSNPSHLQGLNSRQLDAVTSVKGPLLIIAGAGAGKTWTITHRIVHLIKNGIEPHGILAVTFTNKAAKEMRERVITLLQQDSELNRPVDALSSGMSLPFISTFHALGVHILRENHVLLNLNRNFTIFDRADSLRVIKQSLKKLDYDPKQYEPKTILNIISKSKSNNESREEFTGSARGQSYYGEIAGLVWQEYEKVLKSENALDFDDLLVKTYELLAYNESLRNKYQKRWQYIHIDEYQDTNTVQYELIKLLVGDDENICVVGDQDQCVYSWREAKPENINYFENEFHNVKTILLEQNYRSTQNILLAADDIIKKNKKRKDKRLFTENQVGERVVIQGTFSGGAEARFVVEECQKLIEGGVKPSDIAVLYRANFQSRALEERFLQYSVPYQVLGTKFFDRKEIKDILSYLKASINPSSVADITRAVSAPPRGIGKITLSKMISGDISSLTPGVRAKVDEFQKLLANIQKKSQSEPLQQTLRYIVQASGLEQKLKNGTEEDRERLENIKELVTLSAKYDNLEPGEAVEKLLEDVALATDQDELSQESNTVKLMTVHASKGLEFDYVFVTGLEEGLFPHQRLDDDKVDEEEERRLMYVAITRAGKKLFLTYANSRTIYGKEQVNIPSSFLMDLNPEYIEDSMGSVDSEANADGHVDLIDF